MYTKWIYFVYMYQDKVYNFKKWRRIVYNDRSGMYTSRADGIHRAGKKYTIYCR